MCISFCSGARDEGRRGNAEEQEGRQLSVRRDAKALYTSQISCKAGVIGGSMAVGEDPLAGPT